MAGNHDKWMRDQFQIKILGKVLYRNAILHASFIESVCRIKSKSKRDDFCNAIEWLHDEGAITEDEQKAFHAVRDARNQLVHDIVKTGPDGEEIGQWVKGLMDKVMRAYHESPFLKAELLMKYSIDPKDLPKPSPAK
jgi:uncharacterized protein YutE (UPF0331/DUF86 family)